MPLIMSGTIAAIRKGEFDGKPFCSLQFTATDRYGGLRLDTVYLSEDTDVSAYRVGMDIELPVTASVKKGTTQINFRLIDEKADAERSRSRQAAR
jgi:hypothetical protein